MRKIKISEAVKKASEEVSHQAQLAWPVKSYDSIIQQMLNTELDRLAGPLVEALQSCRHYAETISSFPHHPLRKAAGDAVDRADEALANYRKDK